MISLIIGSVAYVFKGQTQQNATSVSLDRASAQTAHETA